MTLSTIVVNILMWLIVVALTIFLFFSFIHAFIAAPFVPSSKKSSKGMIAAAELTKKDVVYDLGSGDGRLVIMAAKHNVKDAVGFEINPLLNLFARIKAKLLRLNNTTFLTKSLWNADLSRCNKLFLYLVPKSMAKLEEKILDEMKPGSIIISHTFSFPNLKPIKELENGKIKVYKIQKN